ncbi:MAG: T9SS type A sorting domain-containing protein [Candidatus Delongbacteria bacterium]|nr:T9SS type A sorting domain-containing protein [Candidatus Delongbacteria bacterium]
MKNIFSTLIILITILNAQDNWSPEFQLSRDGVGPYLFIGFPAISVDSSGTIHAFWVISPSEDGVYNRYSQIEYRRSTDGGITWSETENLTSEYTTERIYYMRTVCDSMNNVHLVYMRGNEVLKVMYKKFDGITWTEPELIGYGTSYLRMNIDSDDRIYATWMIGSEAYFSYWQDGIWSDYAKIGASEYGISDIKFDRNNILYASGTCHTDLRPCLFIYEKGIEEWTSIEDMPNDTLTLGSVLSISSQDTIFINNSYSTYARSRDIHLSKDMLTGEYSKPYEYGDKNAPDREMYLDQHDYLHLFQKHYYVYADTNEDMSLTHSIGKDGYWETTVIDSSDENFSYSEPNVAFDQINNTFNLLYKRHDKLNAISRIYFRSKQNTTDIENNDNIVESHQLYQNYPNPFNSSTKITYSISKTGVVMLNIYNVKGEFIQNLINRGQNKGRYSVLFRADNLNSGVYYYTLSVDEIPISTRKLLYLK